MTLMYTFSRRGRVGAADHARRGFEKCPPCLELHTFTVPPPTRRCHLHGAAASSVLPPFTVPPPTRCCHLRGAAGRGRAVNRYVTFLYRGF